MQIPASQRKPVDVPPEKALTVLVWSASDNDLYDYQIRDLDEMERGCQDNVNVVAQTHLRRPGQETGTVKRLELHNDHQEGLHSPEVEDLGDASMSDPKRLTDFLKWGMEKYPARHYWLILSDHGDGWKGACQDDGHQGWMNTPEIQQALQQARLDTGRKLDLVSFDCCYMGSLEVAHQIHQEATYMVGSEEEVGWFGHDYQRLLSDIKPDVTARQLAEALVASGARDQKEYMTISAIDLEKIPAVTSAFAELSAGAVKMDPTQLDEVVAASQPFWIYRDVVDVAQQFADRQPSLRPVADRVQAAMAEAVIAEAHDAQHPRAHGLQVGISENKLYPEYRTRYKDTAFAQATGWQHVIERLTVPIEEE